MAKKDFRYFKLMQKIAGRDVSDDPVGGTTPLQIGINNIVAEKKTEYGI